MHFPSYLASGIFAQHFIARLCHFGTLEADDRTVIYRACGAEVILEANMNVQVLIDSIVSQVTVLIAQLSTAGGLRSPLHQIANQVFVQLARELEAQGVSRKVSADMFGMALRAYIRKVRRLSEGQNATGVTLWQAVLDFVRSQPVVTRSRLLDHFVREDELQLSSVLHDLVHSGLVFTSGPDDQIVYRASTDIELGELAKLSSDYGLDELIWAVIYREGPLTEAALCTRLGQSNSGVTAALERLTADCRVQRTTDGRLVSADLVLPRGCTQGWEAAVFDHFQAVTQTIAQRLQMSAGGKQRTEQKVSDSEVGGSTYTFDLGRGHPLAAEVKSQLESLRNALGELRRRVDAHNRQNGLPEEYEQVITYVGQCILDKERHVGGGPE